MKMGLCTSEVGRFSVEAAALICTLKAEALLTRILKKTMLFSCLWNWLNPPTLVSYNSLNGNVFLPSPFS
jgi:hypothetical protein